jgi:peptidoglycan/LPS O-acetylase OafA/YrhL
LADYLSSPGTYKFFRHLRLSGASNELPGVFAHTPVPKAVNGALWTIPIEVNWYFILFVLGALGVMRRRYLLLLLSLAFAAYYFGAVAADSNAMPYRYTFGLFFLAGACLYCFQAAWNPRQLVTATVALGASAALACFGHATAALAMCLPFLVVAFGESSTPLVQRFGRYGDFSYGPYIYAFPVQQAVVSLAGNQLTLMQSFVASATCTLALAVLSWHFVEAPALRLKGRVAARTLPGARIAATLAHRFTRHSKVHPDIASGVSVDRGVQD